MIELNPETHMTQRNAHPTKSGPGRRPWSPKPVAIVQVDHRRPQRLRALPGTRRDDDGRITLTGARDADYKRRVWVAGISARVSA